MPTTGRGGRGGRKGACRRGRCTFFRWDFQNCRCRREMSAARMALSKTSFTPNCATMLVSKYGTPSSLATSWPRSGCRMSVGLMGLYKQGRERITVLRTGCGKHPNVSFSGAYISVCVCVCVLISVLVCIAQSSSELSAWYSSLASSGSTMATYLASGRRARFTASRSA